MGRKERAISGTVSVGTLDSHRQEHRVKKSLPEPYSVLSEYWSWSQYVHPAPRHLSALLCTVRWWLAEDTAASRAAVQAVLQDKSAVIESELRHNPEFKPLLEACRELNLPANSKVTLVRLDPLLNSLVHKYDRLPKAIAWKIWNTAPAQLELEELTGIANAGLVAAAARWPSYCAENNFNPQHIQYFQQFATRRIQGAIYDALRAADWATRRLRRNARALLEAGQDSGASRQQMAERTGLTVAEVTETLTAMRQAPVSLEIQETDLTDPIQTVESSLVARQILDVFVQSVQNLSPEERYVIVLKYYSDMSLDDIAVEMGLTKSRVSLLHQDAVLAIHAAMYVYAQPEGFADDVTA